MTVSWWPKEPYYFSFLLLSTLIDNTIWNSSLDNQFVIYPSAWDMKLLESGHFTTLSMADLHRYSINTRLNFFEFKKIKTKESLCTHKPKWSKRRTPAVSFPDHFPDDLTQTWLTHKATLWPDASRPQRRITPKGSLKMCGGVSGWHNDWRVHGHWEVRGPGS